MKAFKIKRGRATYFRVELPQRLSPNGKRISVTAKTRQEALDKARAEVERHDNGLDSGAGDRTLAEFLTEFLAFYKTDGGVAPSTLADYRYHINHHIVPALGQFKLRELSPRHVDEFTRRLAGRGLGPRTVQYAIAVLRRALQFAVDWRYIAANPASSRMRAAKRRTVRQLPCIRFLTPPQAQAFLESVRGGRHEALYVLALTSGMRQGEMLGLHWSDIDFQQEKLTVNRALQRIKHKDPEEEGDHSRVRFGPPKTTQSRRTISIPPIAVEALQEHRHRQQEMRQLAGTDWLEQGLVFTTRTGSPLDTSNVLHQFHEILAKAELPRVRFYDLRHTHASLLIAEGVHPKNIAERLGHSSIKLTMDTYGHLFEGSDRDSAERMERLFGNRSASASVPIENDAPRVLSIDQAKRTVQTITPHQAKQNRA